MIFSVSMAFEILFKFNTLFFCGILFFVYVPAFNPNKNKTAENREPVHSPFDAFEKISYWVTMKTIFNGFVAL